MSSNNYDENEYQEEVQAYDLVHAVLGYAKALEKMAVDLRKEVNFYAQKAKLTPPYQDLHSDIYEVFDDHKAYPRYKELFLKYTPIKLKEIAETLEMLFEDSSNYLNIETGEIIYIEDRYLGMAEDGENPDELDNEMDKDALAIAIDILENCEKYMSLPDKSDVNEYEMMEGFADNYKDKRISDLLQRAISGKGAFRRFKDTILEFGIENEWYEFKDKAYLWLAKEWCKDNNVLYE